MPLDAPDPTTASIDAATPWEGFTPEGELPAGPPPRTWTGLTGFILALLLIIPIAPFAIGRFFGLRSVYYAAFGGAAAGLVACICGIIGVIRARRGRRRGRGLAIAAIPLGLLAGASQLVFGGSGYALLSSIEYSQSAVKVLSTGQEELPTRTADWYDKFTSKQFKANVTKEDFATWVRGILEKHGQLQSANRDLKAPFKRERDTLSVRYTGRFVNSGAPVEVAIFFEDSYPKVDNLRVGDSAVRP